MPDSVILILAITALVISAFTLGWTIYRDVVQKPRFRTSIAVKAIYPRGHPPDGPHIFVEAINLGPIPNYLRTVSASPNWWARRIKRVPIVHIKDDLAHWATTAPNARLDVGDRGTIVLRFTPDCFLKDDFVKVGVLDGFGRTHWAPRSELKNAQKEYRACLENLSRDNGR